VRFVAERLTYANVVATIALFIALGGGAYAVTKTAPPDSVNSKAVIDRQIKPADIANRAVTAATADIANRAVTAAKVDYHSIATGALQDGIISARKIGPITEVSKTKKLFQGEFGEVSVDCPNESDVLITGGANINPTSANTRLQASLPQDDNTWYAKGINTSSTNTANLDVFVRCLGPIG
jgi:hypothetical protein